MGCDARGLGALAPSCPTRFSSRSTGDVVRLGHLARALQGARDALLVKGLQHVVDGVHFEGLHGVMVVGGRENNLRQGLFAPDELLDYPKTVEAGHLHVEKNKLRLVLLDQSDGLQAILSLRDHVDVGKALQQKGELVPRGAFVVDDDGVDGHGRLLREVYRNGAAGTSEESLG